jgi:hypothetical protein
MYSTSGVASRLEVSTNTVQRYGLAWEKTQGEALPHLPGIGRLYCEEVVKSLERAKAWLDAHPEETIDAALKETAVPGASGRPNVPREEGLTLEDLGSTLHDSISHAMMTLLSEIDSLKEQVDGLEREQRAVQALLQRELISTGSRAGEPSLAQAGAEAASEAETLQELPPPAPRLRDAGGRKERGWAFSSSANRLRVPKSHPVPWQPEAVLADPGASKGAASGENLENDLSGDPATGAADGVMAGVRSNRVAAAARGVSSDTDTDTDTDTDIVPDIDGDIDGDAASDSSNDVADAEGEIASLENDGAGDGAGDNAGDSADRAQEEREAQGFIGWFKRNF